MIIRQESMGRFSMGRFFSRLLAAAVLSLAGAGAWAAAVVGQAAPAFSLTDLSGKAVTLADFKGRYVVLEWNNPNCPFVQKHYDSGNMQTLQKRFTADNVSWLLINSTARNHQDFMAPDALSTWVQKRGAVPTAVLLDSGGTVGQAYGARTTPHMYIIDPQGKLVYAGAIDDKRSTNPADVKTSNNYVVRALAELQAGKPVSQASTTPYGCSVKY